MYYCAAILSSPSLSTPAPIGRKSNATPNYFRPSRKIEESNKLMPRRFTKMTYVTEKVGIKGNQKKKRNCLDAIAILKGCVVGF